MNKNDSIAGIKVPGPVFFLILIHLVVFLFTDGKINSAGHDLIIDNWALCWKNLEAGKYKGIISYMFLHADIEHFINNMIMLYAVGGMPENRLKTLKFLIVYFLSGIGGGLTSAFYYMNKGQIVNSIGASAAVFGIIGSTAALMLKSRKYRKVDMRRILFLILISLYGGFTAVNVDNAGHIGGLITGFIVTFIIAPASIEEDNINIY